MPRTRRCLASAFMPRPRAFVAASCFSSLLARPRGDSPKVRPRRARMSSTSCRVLRLLALVPGVVDHHHRRAVAGAEALDLDQRERAAGVGLARLDAESSPHSSSVTRSAPFSAQDSVRQTCSDELPDRPRVEHRVERRDVLDVGARDAEQLGDVADRVGGDVALLVLRQVERRQHRRARLLGRIPLDDLVEARAVLRAYRRTPALRPRAGATTCGRWRRTPSWDESSPDSVSR